MPTPSWWAGYRSNNRIEVDVEELEALAIEVRRAQTALEGSPRYTYCDAGDRDGRLSAAVAEYVDLNQKPRERIKDRLMVAADAIDGAARAFGGVENSLVTALGGEEI